jgi:hypothetical protein
MTSHSKPPRTGSAGPSGFPEDLTRPTSGRGSNQQAGWSFPGAPSAATSSLLETGKHSPHKPGCVLRGTPMLPSTWGPRWSAGFATKRPHSTAASTPGIAALRLNDPLRGRSQKRRSAADSPLDRPSVATSRTRASSEFSLPNELFPALARSLDRSGNEAFGPTPARLRQ